MSLTDLITHIFKYQQKESTRAKALSVKANMVEDKLAPKRDQNKLDHKKTRNSYRIGSNSTFKKGIFFFVCGNLAHHASSANIE